MTLSTFAALIAVLEFVIGLPLVIAPRNAADWILRHVRDDVAHRMTGMLMLCLSVAVLLHDHTVTSDLAGLIRLMALITGIKGLVICWWPASRVRILERVLSSTLRQRLLGVLALSAGTLFAAAAVALG
jgi:threonine/homoserine/homoserine lactone efflux protein